MIVYELGEEASESEVDELVESVEKYTLANHLFWGLWGLISVCKLLLAFPMVSHLAMMAYMDRRPQVDTYTLLTVYVCIVNFWNAGICEQDRI